MLEKPMDDKVEDLLRRRTEIVAGGGEAKVEGQHGKGRKTARERIGALLDPGSLVEIDAAPDSGAMRRQKIEEYRKLFANPYEAAARSYF